MCISGVCLFCLYHISERQLHNQLHAQLLHINNCWGINCVIIPAPMVESALLPFIWLQIGRGSCNASPKSLSTIASCCCCPPPQPPSALPWGNLQLSLILVVRPVLALSALHFGLNLSLWCCSVVQLKMAEMQARKRSTNQGRKRDPSTG